MPGADHITPIIRHGSGMGIGARISVKDQEPYIQRAVGLSSRYGDISPVCSSVYTGMIVKSQQSCTSSVTSPARQHTKVLAAFLFAVLCQCLLSVRCYLNALYSLLFFLCGFYEELDMICIRCVLINPVKDFPGTKSLHSISARQDSHFEIQGKTLEELFYLIIDNERYKDSAPNRYKILITLMICFSETS